MIHIPKPSEAPSLGALTSALDAADHATRLAWCRSLHGPEQYRLFAMAEAGGPLSVEDLVRDDGDVVIHMGRNGLALFNRFQKRVSRLGGETVGYNENEEALGGTLGRFYRWLIGPGHFLAYDSPEVPGEVWIDYRAIPTRQHPDFPPLADNDRGVPSLIFGNMVDILRRVSEHVFIGDSTKTLSPPRRLGHRIGALLPTAPFVVCQVPPDAR